MTRFEVLSTKKLVPEIIEQAKHHDIIISEMDFISVNPIMTSIKWNEVFSRIGNKIIGVVFTSAHAVNTVKKYINPNVNPDGIGWKIFCLSGKTKKAVEAAEGSLGTIAATAENAALLANIIIKQEVKELVFFCSDQRRDELPHILQQNGIVVHEVIVYQTVETPKKMEREFEAILFFSPSAVRSFFSVNQLNENIVCFAIGTSTATAIASFVTNMVFVSESPEQEGMLKAIVQFRQR